MNVGDFAALIRDMKQTIRQIADLPEDYPFTEGQRVDLEDVRRHAARLADEAELALELFEENS